MELTYSATQADQQALGITCSTSPGLGLQIPYLAFCMSTRDPNPSLHPGISPSRILHTRRVVSILLLCVLGKCLQRAPRAVHIPTTADTSAASVEGLTSPAFPGSPGSTQPFQEIRPQATGHTGKLTLRPQPGHTSNFCPPGGRTARGMFPQPTCPWLTIFPPIHVMQPIPFFLCHSATELISSHGTPIP